INDGLCTLEMHRELPIQIQAKHLWATGVIDDVIIGNAYASEEELKVLGSLNRDLLELDVAFMPEATKLEQTVVENEMHIRRGDISEYMTRSTEVRKSYQDHRFEPGRTEKLAKGDVVIGNDHFGKYKGELHVVLKE